MSSPLDRIGPLLAQHLGLEVSSIGSASVLAAVGVRAEARGVTPSDYAGMVNGDAVEIAALVDEIVVPESWFFRDRVPFTHLASFAAEKLRTTKLKKFRVLSAPCSTGEEPHTVAMAMLDAGVAPHEFQIEAVDVSPPLLAAAKRGVYRPVSFRGTDLAYRDRYFTPADEGTWQLVDLVRSAVKFRPANLTAKELLPGEGSYDAILCRNLLIYLTADARRALLSRLAELLVEGGLLIVGHAEALEVIDPRFKSIGVSGAFTYTLRATTDKAPVLRPVRMTPVGIPVLRRDERATQPSAPLAKPVDQLAAATVLADRGQLAEAATIVEQHLAIAGADGAAWALLGSIRQASGDATRAEECFSRALYCDPGMYNALVSLALLLEKRGETAGAQNLRRRAERAKHRTPPRGNA